MLKIRRQDLFVHHFIMLIPLSTQEVTRGVARIRKCLRRFFSRRNPKLWAWSEFIWCHMDSWKQWVGHFRRAVWIVPWVWFPFVLNLDCPRRGFHADFSITNIFLSWWFTDSSVHHPWVLWKGLDFSSGIGNTAHRHIIWIWFFTTHSIFHRVQMIVVNCHLEDVPRLLVVHSPYLCVKRPQFTWECVPKVRKKEITNNRKIFRTQY